MASKTISALTAAATFAATDNLAAAVGGNTRRVTGTVLANFLATATLDAGTLTTSQPMTLAQTWNAGAVTFTAFKVNVTATASAAASLLLDLQVASTSVFRIDKAGNPFTPGIVGSGTTNYFGGATANQASFKVTSNSVVVWSSGFLGFNSQDDLSGGALDVVLRRDAANTLALRNGATAQTLRVYGTFTDASNGDYFSIAKAAAGATTLSTVGVGTGTGGDMQFSVPVTAGAGIAATSVAKFAGGSGHFLWNTDNTYDIGASAATRPRTLYLGTSIVTPGGTSFHTTSTALTDSAAAQVATMTNGPTAGNPTKWIGINDNGTVRQIPAW